MTTSNSNSAHAESSEVCFISTERHLVLLMKDEQPPVTEADQLSLYLTDGTGGSPPPARPGLPDCKQLGNSPKDEAADSCSLSAGNKEDEEVRCQSDCTSKDAVHGTGLCNTRSQFAEVLETNQRREELDFSRAEGESPISSRDYAEFKPLYSESEKDPSGNLAEGGKKGKNKLEVQIYENENVSICKGETKGRGNESKTFIPSAAKCDEGSVLCNDVVLIGNIAAEKASLEVDNHSGADHEESAEGDNDEDPFCVIDPAIRSEADEEAEGMNANSDGTAGKEKVCGMEAPLPLCSDVGTLQKVSSADQAEQFDQQSRTQPCRAKNEVHCQSYAELHACSVNNETCDITGDEGSCQWKSSPLKPPPAGDGGTQESHDTQGHQLKEQSQSSCFPESVDHMKTQVVGYPHRETDKVETTAEIKEKEGGLNFLEKTEIDEQGKSEEKLELQSDKDETDASAVDHSEEETQNPTELGDKPECLCDQMCVTTEREERKEDINVDEEMKTEEKSEDDVQKQSEKKEDVSLESPVDWTEGSRLAFCNGDDQEQRFTSFTKCSPQHHSIEV
ncbi:uncharacterized protein LOC121634217 [Melanotaenia boesemani]|uniref:uncharacterized protein LOC121634217 n=1 Tax=Melanotaenia boesemani TaxID=1250792 RepID=UPI001C040970|nr:uncharacterized protein LOC121634217 [Melanotaenia boesemani]